MYGPRVFVSMLGALIFFAVAIYALSGSIGTTLWQTAVCALLLQIGYFIGVLFLVSRAARQKSMGATVGDPRKTDQDSLKSNAAPVSQLNAPEHSNL